jgi:DNA-binding ferritin-like protein
MFNDFNILLEAEDEEKKEKEEEKKEEKKEKDEEEKKDDDKKKDEEPEDSDEYNDIMADDDDPDTDTEDDDDEWNDSFMGDDDDLTSDEDPTADDSSEDSGDFNTLVIVGKEGEGAGSDDLYEKLAKLAYACVVVSNNMKHIHLNTSGRKFEEIHNQSEEYYRHFAYKTDEYFELAAESPAVKLDNPTRAKEHVEDIEVESEGDYGSFELAQSRMSANLSKIIDYLKEAREAAGNARPDIQSRIDDELGYLNKQVNFIIRKKLSGDGSSRAEAIVAATTESFNWLI